MDLMLKKLNLLDKLQDYNDTTPGQIVSYEEFIRVNGADQKVKKQNIEEIVKFDNKFVVKPIITKRSVHKTTIVRLCLDKLYDGLNENWYSNLNATSDAMWGFNIESIDDNLDREDEEAYYGDENDEVSIDSDVAGDLVQSNRSNRCRIDPLLRPILKEAIIYMTFRLDIKISQIINIFKHFGNILYVNKIDKKDKISNVSIIFDCKYAACGAFSQDVITYKDDRVPIRYTGFPKVYNETTITIKGFPYHTTVDEIKQHFRDYGIIQHACIVHRKLGFRITHALVTFSNVQQATHALQMHNRTLNGRKIAVNMIGKYDNDFLRIGHTISILNKNNLKTLEEATLRKIFKDCENIEYLKVVCGKYKLAYITVPKMSDWRIVNRLKGKTIEGVELFMEPYRKPIPMCYNDSHKRSIFISNMKPETTFQDIRKLFGNPGRITNFDQIGFIYAIIEYETLDACYKALALNNCEIRGQKVTVQPLLEAKRKMKEKYGTDELYALAYDFEKLFKPKGLVRDQVLILD